MVLRRFGCLQAGWTPPPASSPPIPTRRCKSGWTRSSPCSRPPRRGRLPLYLQPDPLSGPALGKPALEHELYCHGHLIEAGVCHHAATGETRLLNLVRRSADLLVRDFMDATPTSRRARRDRDRPHPPVPCHRRGALPRAGPPPAGTPRAHPRVCVGILRQSFSTGRRMSRRQRRKAYRRQAPRSGPFVRPPRTHPRFLALMRLRAVHSMLSGRLSNSMRRCAGKPFRSGMPCASPTSRPPPPC